MPSRSCCVGLLDHRHDQSPVERDGDADVHVAVIDDVVAVDRRVHDGHGSKRIGRRLDDERHVGELRAGFLVFGLLRLAHLRDAREVHFEDRVHVSRRPAARDHVLGDLLPHHRHRLNLAGPGAGGRRGAWRGAVAGVGAGAAAGAEPGAAPRPVRDEIEDVVFGHAPGDAGARDPRDVDVVVLRDLANERRRALVDSFFDASARGRATWRGRRCEAAGRRRAATGRALVGSAAGPAGGGPGAGCAAAGAWSGGRRSSPPACTDHGHDAVDRHGLAFLDANLREHAGGGRRNLRVHLVGRDLEQRLVASDLVAELLDPANDRSLGDRFAHLRHHDIRRHVSYSPTMDADGSSTSRLSKSERRLNRPATSVLRTSTCRLQTSGS